MATSNTPGLQWREREGGVRKPYWYALPGHIKKGYRPKSVPLIYDPTSPLAAEALSSQCMRLQADMLAWVHRNGAAKTDTLYDGTLETLVKIYQTNEGSPYFENHPKTQKTYSDTLRLLLKKVPGKFISQLNGDEIKRWHRNMLKLGLSAGYAALTINILKAVLSYGASLGHDDCAKLRLQMQAAKFGSGKKRKERLTYEHVRKFRIAAHKAGRPSAALWLTLQSELGLRRRDVIGEWRRLVDDEEVPVGGIVDGRYVWRDGLTWAHLDEAGILKKLVSKTAKTSEYVAEHDINEYPDLAFELARVPLNKRVGPIVINETTGRPYWPHQCKLYFRRIARLAGIPDSIQNMDARAGAVTESLSSAATLTDTMAFATHTEQQTTLGYNRTTLEQSRRVARARVQSRQKGLENG